MIAIGAGGTGALAPAILGAASALVVVVGLGLALYHPLAAMPENALKFLVGVLLSAFGTFWVGKGLALGWPGADLAILGLIGAYLLIALVMVPLCRRLATSRTGSIGEAA